MKRVLVVLLILVLANFISASNINCTLLDNKAFVEASMDDGAEITLPEEYSLLEKNGNKISFISRDFLRKSGNEWIFVFPRISESTYDLKVSLPENYILSDELVYPKNYQLSTNGKNIILKWTDFNDDEIVIFYKGASNSNILPYLIFTFLLGVASILFYFQWKRFREKIEAIKKKKTETEQKLKTSKKDAITKNLFGDEKNIVNYLLSKKGKTSWTKELMGELGISKVRLSRKIRSLAEKGLLKKERFGNENKISLN